ncbi:hypothetical protein BV20DRAFT_1053592 [Pilatotrama ljubarskyi]|nr:hypothetical protein BV20DRAFT_1053592 [Pilatotrama ljubarskyi]
MRAFSSLYEEPAFPEPSQKERSVFYAVVGAAVTIASTVAAIQIKGSPEWLSHAYVRIRVSLSRAAFLTASRPLLSSGLAPRSWTEQACEQPLVGTLCRLFGFPAR